MVKGFLDDDGTEGPLCEVIQVQCRHNDEFKAQWQRLCDAEGKSHNPAKWEVNDLRNALTNLGSRLVRKEVPVYLRSIVTGGPGKAAKRYLESQGVSCTVRGCEVLAVCPLQQEKLELAERVLSEEFGYAETSLPANVYRKRCEPDGLPIVLLGAGYKVLEVLHDGNTTHVRMDALLEAEVGDEEKALFVYDVVREVRRMEGVVSVSFSRSDEALTLHVDLCSLEATRRFCDEGFAFRGVSFGKVQGYPDSHVDWGELHLCPRSWEVCFLSQARAKEEAERNGVIAEVHGSRAMVDLQKFLLQNMWTGELNMELVSERLEASLGAVPSPPPRWSEDGVQRARDWAEGKGLEVAVQRDGLLTIALQPPFRSYEKAVSELLAALDCKDLTVVPRFGGTFHPKINAKAFEKCPRKDAFHELCRRVAAAGRGEVSPLREAEGTGSLSCEFVAPSPEATQKIYGALKKTLAVSTVYTASPPTGEDRQQVVEATNRTFERCLRMESRRVKEELHRIESRGHLVWEGDKGVARVVMIAGENAPTEAEKLSRLLDDDTIEVKHPLPRDRRLEILRLDVKINGDRVVGRASQVREVTLPPATACATCGVECHLVRQLSCGHGICLSSAWNMLRAAADRHYLPIECPECNRPIPMRVLRALLAITGFDEGVLFENALLKSPLFRKCRNPGCQRLAAEDGVCSSDCSASSVELEQTRKLLEREEQAGRGASCPRCNLYGFASDKCNRITCIACCVIFCGVCREELDESDYRHFSGRCAGPA